MEGARENGRGELEGEEFEEVAQLAAAEPADRQVVDRDAVGFLEERLIFVPETDDVDVVAGKGERARLPRDPRVIRIVRVTDDADARHHATPFTWSSGARTAPRRSPLPRSRRAMVAWQPGSIRPRERRRGRTPPQRPCTASTSDGR